MKGHGPVSVTVSVSLMRWAGGFPAHLQPHCAAARAATSGATTPPTFWEAAQNLTLTDGHDYRGRALQSAAAPHLQPNWLAAVPATRGAAKPPTLFDAVQNLRIRRGPVFSHVCWPSAADENERAFHQYASSRECGASHQLRHSPPPRPTLLRREPCGQQPGARRGAETLRGDGRPSVPPMQS